MNRLCLYVTHGEGTALPPQSSCTWLSTVCSIKAAVTCPQHWVDSALLSCQGSSNASIEPYVCCAICPLPLHPWYHRFLLCHYRLRAPGSRNCAVLCPCLLHGTRDTHSIKTSEDLSKKGAYKKPF